MILQFHPGGDAHRLKIVELHRRVCYHEGLFMPRHPAYHLILVTQGNCELLVPDRAPVRCPLNSLIIIQPEFPHDFRTDDDGVEHSCIIFTLENSRRESCTVPFDHFFDPQAAARPYRVILLSDSNSAVLLKQLNLAIGLREKSRTGFALEVAVHSLLMNCLTLGYPEYFTPFEMGRKEKNAEKVRILIEQNIWNPDFNLPMLARQLNLHPNHLNAVFTEVEKIPIGEYLIRRRLQRAGQMLAAGHRCKQVADACGFRSLSYFSRLFRQRFGCSPRQYQAKETI